MSKELLALLQTNPVITKVEDCSRNYSWGTTRLRVSFPNGYEMSIIQGHFEAGFETGFYEIAILKDGDICYDTPITDDVIGHLTKDEVIEYTNKISKLPIFEKGR